VPTVPTNGCIQCQASSRRRARPYPSLHLGNFVTREWSASFLLTDTNQCSQDCMVQAQQAGQNFRGLVWLSSPLPFPPGSETADTVKLILHPRRMRPKRQHLAHHRRYRIRPKTRSTAAPSHKAYTPQMEGLVTLAASIRQTE